MFGFIKKDNTLIKGDRIFLDYASSTPISKNVLKEMDIFFADYFYNPSSIHKEGVLVKKIIEDARIKIARILSVKESDIYFTNGGTESTNMAIQGLIKKVLENKNFEEKTPHIIVSQIEHPAVLECAKQLEKEGKVIVSYVAPNEHGIVTPDSIIKEIKKETILISVMYVNSEIGTISQIGKISKALKEYKKENNIGLEEYPFIHTDASQAPNYLSVQIEKLGVDMMTLDGSKIYGPKSSGILFKKNSVPISSIFYGGGQEGGIRAGTENVAGIVGFAKALEESQDKNFQEKENKRLLELRTFFISSILKKIPNSSLNGSDKKDERIPNNVNICFPNQNAEFLVLKLDAKGIAVASTTACKSLDDTSHSYVIESLGEEKKSCADSSIRFSFGRTTTRKELEKTITVLEEIINI